MKKIMKNKSNGKNYNKEGELVSKENLELNAFHTQVTNKLKEDKIRVQNLYRDELILELEKNVGVAGLQPLPFSLDYSKLLN